MGPRRETRHKSEHLFLKCVLILAYKLQGRRLRRQWPPGSDWYELSFFCGSSVCLSLGEVQFLRELFRQAHCGIVTQCDVDDWRVEYPKVTVLYEGEARVH